MMGRVLLNPTVRRGAALAALLLLGAGARAGCSRDINVPLAPLGASVVVDGDQIGGIYPEMLREIGARAGCHFIMTIVPRARLNAMFEAGTADIMLPSVKSAIAAADARFVPLIGSRTVLISATPNAAAIHNARQLLERRDVRIALVRGADFGENYQWLLVELNKQGRVYYEADPISVARLLDAGFADATIMATTTLSGAIRNDKRVTGLLDKLSFTPLPELRWDVSGVSISKKSLTPADQTLLRELFERAARSGSVLEAFQHHHSADILAPSVRALPAPKNRKARTDR
jgi:polar amino acid transport system substrate-binding protein